MLDDLAFIYVNCILSIRLLEQILLVMFNYFLAL